MKYFVIFFFLIGFVGSALALDEGNSHPTEISLEEYYKIEILGLKDEYIVGEKYSFYFVISGNGYSCANYQVSYPDENGNIVHMGAEVLCTSEQSMHEFNFNPLGGKRTLGNIGIDKPGTYTVTVTFEKPSKYYPTTISKEFRVVESFAENFNKLPPLKQIKAGIAIEEIQCKDSLVLIIKYDVFPACVTYQTGSILVKRGWATCDDGISHGRGHPCGPRSSGVVIFDKESYKPVYPKFDGVTEIINPEHESLKYRDTSQVIDDTYLSKNVQQWKDVWQFEIDAGYEKYGDEFYIELGRLLMKNEMQYQMKDLGIVNAEDNFEVIYGMMLTSLPPHIGFSSIVNATDGHYYWLQGTTHANQVSYYKTTQLQYPDPIEVDFDKKTQDQIPTISILPKGNNDLKSIPRIPVLSQPGKVEFFNETPGTLTLFLNKDGLDEFSFETSQKLSIKTNTGKVWEFSEPGSYHWDGEVPTIINGKEYKLNTGGGILVLADDMSELSKEEQMETARTILIASGLPITGMGQKGEDDTIYISLSEAINELLPESKQYYLERAQNLIPFDISIKLDD